MASSNLTIRIDSDLKEDTAKIVEHYGLDLSSVVRVFFTQIVNTGTIPLSFDYDQPNEESIRAIRETESMIKTGSGDTFTTGHDLLKAALE